MSSRKLRKGIKLTNHLEAMLDSFDPSERKEALEVLCEKVESGDITLPEADSAVNLHYHTFFSYNCCGYSPSTIAWRARRTGLVVAGIVDFDVLDGLEEFYQAGDMLGLNTTVGIETRVFIPEFADKEINSPGEPGIAYHMGIGIPRADLNPGASDFQKNLAMTSEKRNRDLLGRVNEYFGAIALDYDSEVLPLTPLGNATERHITLAYVRKAIEVFGEGKELSDFWAEKLGTDISTLDLPDGATLQNAVRAKTMKRGGVGYVQPDGDLFPTMADMNRFVLDAGGIPAYAWLDGTSSGEREIERLLDLAMSTGVAALNIIPDRNYIPGLRDEKLVNLQHVIDLAEKLELLLVVGTEMNSPGQKFVDAFQSAELSPFVPLFLRGARAAYEHSCRGRRPAEVGMPVTQRAVQLVGPDELKLNGKKPVPRPGSHQIVCRVEAAGLCFSDLKLLKQFAEHARKGPIVSGIDPAVLEEIASYVPRDLPTVPGHEVVVRVASVGGKVERFKPDERYLVQTDYRWLPTKDSNAAFGYNFEGGLQEYVLMDERVITSPEGDSMLIPVSDQLSASAVALVEPWACVEDSYVSEERRSCRSGGTMLVVAEEEVREGVVQLLNDNGAPARMTWLSDLPAPEIPEVPIGQIMGLGQVEDGSCDDIVYAGSSFETVERLFAKLGPGGMLNITLCGGRFGREVLTPVGRVHYGGIRIVGTTTKNPSESIEKIPVTGEIREGDRISVVGAGGPMGLMHVVRNVCQGVSGISIFAGDLDAERLRATEKIALPIAAKNGVTLTTYNPSAGTPAGDFDYIALMVPAAGLVASAVQDAAKSAIINIFAGIPADVSAKVDLDAYIEKSAYFIGTSGSVLTDMKIVLEKVESGQLDTNVSVAAVCGLDGAVDGIRAVENRLIAGKIIAYPSCGGLGLVKLEDMKEEMPHVAVHLTDGCWTQEAEKALSGT
ncbi:alcohol dehydrogenase catalytic domain-containing protein [Planctomycetota bacterium]